MYMPHLRVVCTLRQMCRTICLLVGIGLVPGSVPPVTGQTPTNALPQPFDYTTTKIGISPASKWGVFKFGDTVTISTSNNISITVFDLYGQTEMLLEVEM